MKDNGKISMEEFITGVIYDFKNLETVGELFLEIFAEMPYNEADERCSLQNKQLYSLIEVMKAFVREFKPKLGLLADYEALVNETVKDDFYVDAAALPQKDSCGSSETRPPYLKVWREKK